MFVDSHCHLEMEAFEKDRDKVIEKSRVEGLAYMLTVATEEQYFKKMVEIIDRYDIVYGAIGIHPHNSKDYSDATAKTIRQYLKHKKIVGYGEIGLDFYRNYSPEDLQLQAFRSQLEFAKTSGLPVIVHSRNAQAKTLSILKDTFGHSASGVIHCFSYDTNTAKKLLDMGFYISIPGTITYNGAQSLADAVKSIPMDRLLAETDAPFLTPAPHRGKRNEPYFVKLTTEKIAKIKKRDIEEVASAMYENFLNAFPKIQTGGTQ